MRGLSRRAEDVQRTCKGRAKDCLGYRQVGLAAVSGEDDDCGSCCGVGIDRRYQCTEDTTTVDFWGKHEDPG